MRTIQEQQCLEAENEYRAWSECPLWYCVKTVFKNDGTLTSEFYADEKTKLPVMVQSREKPMDGVFEDATGTTYYTYHQGYEAAARQIAAARI